LISPITDNCSTSRASRTQFPPNRAAGDSGRVLKFTPGARRNTAANAAARHNRPDKSSISIANLITAVWVYPLSSQEAMPTTYAETWFPVLIQIIIALGVATAMIGLSALLGKRVRDPVKSSPYESGMRPVGNARERFSVKFYLVAMVFILFDIEAIFLYPWAVVYRQLKLFGFLEMLLFIVLVLCGFYYIWKKGVLNWSIDERKLEQTGEGKRAA
jgi:NADH-quinone oxidoreductase subunit A